MKPAFSNLHSACIPPDSSHLGPVLPLGWITNSRARKATFPRIKHSLSFNKVLSSPHPHLNQSWSGSANCFTVGRTIDHIENWYRVTSSLASKVRIRAWMHNRALVQSVKLALVLVLQVHAGIVSRCLIVQTPHSVLLSPPYFL